MIASLCHFEVSPNINSKHKGFKQKIVFIYISFSFLNGYTSEEEESTFN